MQIAQRGVHSKAGERPVAEAVAGSAGSAVSEGSRHEAFSLTAFPGSLLLV